MSLACNPAIGNPIRGPESTTTGVKVFAATLTGGKGPLRDTRSVTDNAPTATPEKNTPKFLARMITPSRWRAAQVLPCPPVWPHPNSSGGCTHEIVYIRCAKALESREFHSVLLKER